jgi:uncharacterized protein YkwD
MILGPSFLCPLTVPADPWIWVGSDPEWCKVKQLESGRVSCRKPAPPDKPLERSLVRPAPGAVVAGGLPVAAHRQTRANPIPLEQPSGGWRRNAAQASNATRHPGIPFAPQPRHSMKPLSVLTLAIGLALTAPSLIAQTEYGADGQPSALEEEIRWLTNRARHDTASENAVRGTSYTDVPASTGPLAPHHGITLAARRHSEDMARNNTFQHDTVPGSAYYDPVTQPKSWDRMQAEGYDYTRAGENIAAGYSSAAAAYAGWWNSTGHRLNLCNAAFREIGNGFFFWQDSTYRRYYTMNLGTAGSTHFFTGTLFHDANHNGVYNQNEGESDVRVSLRIHGVPHSHSDLSTDVGSFAIPIQSIASGNTVEVLLANTTDSTTSLSIPRDFHTLETVTLAPGEERPVGSFVKASGTRNVGFRDLTPPIPSLPTPTLVLTRIYAGVELHWASQTGVRYQPQASSDLVTWLNLATEPQPGTGTDMSWSDPLPPSPAAFRFYRLAVTVQ